MRIPPEIRFWAKVKKGTTDQCWEWLGGKGGWKGGYGNFWTGNKQDGAHRFSLRLKLGRDLSPGEQACHHCDNPGCVNPDHLFSGNQKDNIRDAIQKGRLDPRHPQYGSKQGNSKLTEDQVRVLRKLNTTGAYTFADLGRMFKITKENTSLIVRRKAWKHI